MVKIRKAYRISRWIMLAAMIIGIGLMSLKPAPIKAKSPSSQTAAAESFGAKINALEEAQARGESGAQVRLTGEEISAAFSQATTAVRQSAPSASAQTSAADFRTPHSPRNSAPNSNPEPPPIHDVSVVLEDDLIRSQFVAQVYGKDVYVTLAGHLGSHNGYVTFTPTQFKVGDLYVPLSLVGSELQKKMAEPETREKMKLPEFVQAVYIEGGQLVITEK